jgi:hypothetical protein
MNNFTPRAQQVLALLAKKLIASITLRRTEHLLLGLIKLGQGVAVNVLQTMGPTSRRCGWKSRNSRLRARDEVVREHPVHAAREEGPRARG